MAVEYIKKTKAYKLAHDLRIEDPPEDNDYELGWNDALESVVQAIRKTDPHTMRRITQAEWVWDADEHGWKCTRCGTINENLHRMKGVDITVWKGGKFCPECGATMSSHQQIAPIKIWRAEHGKKVKNK